jgi:hypothetical protein
LGCNDKSSNDKDNSEITNPYGGGETETPNDPWTTATNPKENMYGVWGSGPKDVWAVGDNNNILHWDGEAWSSSLSGTNGYLKAVWGSSATDVWAVGASYISIGGTAPADILHWDGSQWTASDANGVEELEGIWGNSADDVWAVGSSVAHWDGQNWAPTESQFEAHAIWGAAADDIWAVGGSDISEGVIWHYDGQSWEKVLEGTSTFALFGLRGVWGSAANDVWAFGWKNTAHWDGKKWTVEPCTDESVSVPVGTSGGCPTGLSAAWGSSSKDIWAIGSGCEGGCAYGYVEHWDGKSWTMMHAGMQHGLTSIWGSDEKKIWAVGPSLLSGGIVLNYAP